MRLRVLVAGEHLRAPLAVLGDLEVLLLAPLVPLCSSSVRPRLGMPCSA